MIVNYKDQLVKTNIVDLLIFKYYLDIWDLKGLKYHMVNNQWIVIYMSWYLLVFLHHAGKSYNVRTKTENLLPYRKTWRWPCQVESVILQVMVKFPLEQATKTQRELEL